MTWGALSYILVGFRVRGLPAGVEQTAGSGIVARLLPLPEALLPLPACPDEGARSSCSPSVRSLQPFWLSALPQCRSDHTARRCRPPLPSVAAHRAKASSSAKPVSGRSLLVTSVLSSCQTECPCPSSEPSRMSFPLSELPSPARTPTHPSESLSKTAPHETTSDPLPTRDVSRSFSPAPSSPCTVLNRFFPVLHESPHGLSFLTHWILAKAPQAGNASHLLALQQAGGPFPVAQGPFVT